MACGCSKRGTTGTQYQFVYTNARGETTTYDNQFEARARVLREGGSWAKVPVAA